MIKPSNGRIVLFTPGPQFGGTQHDRAQPLAAIVTHVFSDRCINVSVFDSNGCPCQATSVQLLQDADTPHADQFAEWMPYQKGQAAKYDELAKKVDAG